MLESLCGNKSIEKILIFLFVNNKCYGTQLHRALKTPLTPLQKALNRLEKGGIITSYYEGKTRLYQFNPAYPLITELEHLIKKAYTLLPANEKKNYYVVEEIVNENSQNLQSAEILMNFWKKLGQVKNLAFHAKTKSKDYSGWNGKGKGEVSINQTHSNVLIFNERGVWQNDQGSELRFSNSFRCTLDTYAGIISLEHLRRGLEHPVFLFHLAPVNKQLLSSVDSHLCQGDVYFGTIQFNTQTLRLNWRVIGPKKNETIDYFYS